jgi:competence protein ComGC
MPDKKAEETTIDHKSRFTLIDLLSVIILVGLLFVFIVPVNQAKVSRNLIADALGTIQMISQKAADFKNNPDNGYYPDIAQLNLGKQIESDYFEYSIGADDSTVVAITKSGFGKKGAYLVYSMTGKQYRIGKNDSDQLSSKYINENWLP